MSTPVNTSFTGLKATTAQIMAIIMGARQLPPGPSHDALKAQVALLVHQAVKEAENLPYIPGLVCSCSKELMRVRGMNPKVWPDWHSIGYDDARLQRHPWRSRIQAWEALGDDSFNLPVAAAPSTGPIPVSLPPTPVIPSIVHPVVPGTTTEARDKGKGKAVFVDPSPEAEGSRKRKSPMISGLPSQTPKSAMKTRKRAKPSRVLKSKEIIESEDEEDPVVKPFPRGLPEVVLPPLSSFTKQPLGPAEGTAGSPPAVIEPSQSPPGSPEEAPPVTTDNILIPGPNNPCHACIKQDWPCETRADRRTGMPCMSCVWCTTKKIKCVLATLASPPKRVRAQSTTRRTRSKTPSKAPSTAPSTSQPQARTRSQSRGPSRTPIAPAATTPKPQTRGRSRTITAVKAPAPAPAPAPVPVPAPAQARRPAVPATALALPMPDLHAMAIAIREGAARIAVLEHRVAEQDRTIDTLQRLHESLRREVVDRHSSFPLPEPPVNLLDQSLPVSMSPPECALALPANATSLLLDQTIPASMSPPESALPPLINLSMVPTPPKLEVELTSPKPEDSPTIEGLKVEPMQVHPEGPLTSGDIVDPGGPGNLVPEYNSADDDMEVEVKVEPSCEDSDMAM